MLSIGLVHQSAAQDGVELRGLQVNTNLINAKKMPSRKSANSLPVPFFDDFSSLQSSYPNPKLWQNNLVFVNADFPIFPPSIGVATFDAFNANGRLYSHAATYPFNADTLTSQPIRLDSVFSPIPHKLTADDSVYFSFYYQPGGGFVDGDSYSGEQRGRAPGKNDLFILEFLDRTNQWNEIWRENGQTLDEFCPLCAKDTADFLKTYFKQVLILIDLESYLYDGFQFRFVNVSTLDQNQTSAGQWHLDYVRLANNRSMSDTFSNDIAFVNRTERVLKDFQAMPFKQFQPAKDLVDEMPLMFRNLDQTAQVASYQYLILDKNGQTVWDMVPSNANIFPFYTNGFNSDPDLSKPQLLYNFPNVNGSETFEIQHTLKRAGSQDICATNDTMVQTVHFGNYYAYDDGTAEVGFGLRDGENGQFAYRFPLRMSDTLVAIQILFNHTLEDMSQTYLNLAVWSAENDSTPSQRIYAGQRFSPTYNDTIGFQTYILDNPIFLDSTVVQKGAFFIGFQQQTKGFLNIGFDQNNNAKNCMFLLDIINNQWNPVIYYGSVMIRPVFGTAMPTGFSEKDIRLENINIYPNPSDGVVFVESPEMLVTGYEIYDLTGRRLLQKTCRETQFSIHLPEKTGVYILLLNTEKGLVSKKIIRR